MSVLLQTLLLYIELKCGEKLGKFKQIAYKKSFFRYKSALNQSKSLLRALYHVFAAHKMFLLLFMQLSLG